MPQLSRRQDYLASMMSFMNNQICYEMKSIRRDVTPWDVHSQLASVFEAGGQKVNYSLIAKPKSFQQLALSYQTAIDAFRHLYAILSPDHLDPHTAGVVHMPDNHANRSLRHSGEFLAPECIWKVFDKELRHPVARLPGGNQINVLVFGHLVED